MPFTSVAQSSIGAGKQGDSSSYIEFRPATRFRLRWFLAMDVIRFFLGISLLALQGAVALVASWGLWVVMPHDRLPAFYFLLCFAFFGFNWTGLFTFFLPIMNCYPIIERYFPAADDGFVSQITFLPLRYEGFRTWHSADDFGILRIVDRSLHFSGDATDLRIAFEDIECAEIRKGGAFTLSLDGIPPLIRLKDKLPDSEIWAFKIKPVMGLTFFDFYRANRDFIDALRGIDPKGSRGSAQSAENATPRDPHE